MKFLPIIENETAIDVLKSEYESATKYGKVFLGNTVIFYKKRFNKCLYLPIENIYRAFRRVKAVPVRFRNSSSEIRLEYLVLSSNKEEIAEFDFPNADTVNKILAELQIKSPKIKIGKKEK